MSDADDAPRWQYDPVRTLAGDLQRGHGMGVVKAHAEAAGPDAVFACVQRDHRWWWLDERPEYLARLMLKLRMDPTAVVALLHAAEDLESDDDNTFDMALGVLETLGFAGDEQVVRALRHYVIHGVRWLEVLEAIARRWPRATWDDLDGIALARLTPAMADEVFASRQPWLGWAARHARVARLAQRRSARPPRPAPALAPDADQLLALLADPAQPRADKRSALRDLARSGSDRRLLGLAEELRGIPGLSDAVMALGPAALDHARAWVTGDRLVWLGGSLLAAHGTERDIPRLLAVWDRLWDSDDWCGFDRLADGFARFGALAADAAPRLRAVIRQTPHSYERTACLRALLAIDPVGAEGPLALGLLDCEQDVRSLAVAHAPDSKFTRQALTTRKDDPTEAPEIRQAAAARLG
ncbi:hypothetical protein [Catellatospora vulcania]|uniref:hypothetical protein n=1 Tax=Catellatospora vulcania TaxID=1460450 RepID=UPI0012D46820|nr:hypothetical protein [Catellatospora vulcania]